MKMLRKSFKWSLFLMAVLTVISCNKEEEEDPNAPEACIDPPEELVAGEALLFNASCSFNAQSFMWDFGDGGTSQAAIPTYTYAEGGTYTVTLIIDNGEGLTDELTLEVVVETPSIIEHSGYITEDETWIDAVHLVTSDVYVDGATLTIEPGAVVMFASGRGLYIGYTGGSSGATLLAEGSADKPITFTSSAATKTPGDWDFIGFYDGASSVSSMKYCMVEFGGGYSDNYGSIHIESRSLSIENTTISYSENFGVSAGNEGFFQSFENNELTENGKSAISIYGNYVHTLGAGNSIDSPTGIRVIADNLEQENVTWLKQTAAYYLDGDLYVGSETGTIFTLSPGVEVRMGGGSGIYIGYFSGTFGTLKADGTEEERILFTSAASQANRSAGDWDMIAFYDGAGSGSSMAYCDIEYGGGYSANYGMISLNGSGIALTNSTLRNSESMGLSLTSDAHFEAFSDNTFEAIATFPVEIYANYAHTIGSGNSYISTQGILVQSDRVENADETWIRQEVPYIIDGYVDLGSEAGAKLTLQPGIILKFTEGSRFRIGYFGGTFGILSAVGESGNPITFTSGAPEGFESPGDWDGIWFDNGTGSNTVLENCIVAYAGGYGSNSGNLNVVNENPGVPSITNCQITHSGAWGIYVNNQSSASVTDVTYANNSSGDINQ
jgi:PKD repeat protein